MAITGIKHYPYQVLKDQFNDACTNGTLDDVKILVNQWRNMLQSSPPDHDPLSSLEPTLHHAIREDRADIVAYFLDQGLQMSRQAAWEAIASKASPSMWQVFLDHGLDINDRLDDGLCGPPPLLIVSTSSKTRNQVRWFLAHGANPNAESRHGLSPFLRALLLAAAAGASPTIAVPFVCSAPRTRRRRAKRLAMLRCVLDAGADPDAPKWAHNRRGYAGDFDWGSGLLNLALSYGAEGVGGGSCSGGARGRMYARAISCRGGGDGVGGCEAVRAGVGWVVGGV
ncbi:hypothetical protein F5B20DRAFT_594232 [Whalleya microplaca]|nr:hypothetical protein F5B20DRAFT_594232 [Whalleya microplaca]